MWDSITHHSTNAGLNHTPFKRGCMRSLSLLASRGGRGGACPWSGPSSCSVRVVDELPQTYSTYAQPSATDIQHVHNEGSSQGRWETEHNREKPNRILQLVLHTLDGPQHFIQAKVFARIEPRPTIRAPRPPATPGEVFQNSIFVSSQGDTDAVQPGIGELA